MIDSNVMFGLGLLDKLLLLRSDKKFWCKRVLASQKGLSEKIMKDPGASQRSFCRFA